MMRSRAIVFSWDPADMYVNSNGENGWKITHSTFMVYWVGGKNCLLFFLHILQGFISINTFPLEHFLKTLMPQRFPIQDN